MPYLGSCGSMDVKTLPKGLYHVLITTEMSHDAKLNLRIVGREEHAILFWNKTFPDFFSVFTSHGNILQIRVARG